MMLPAQPKNRPTVMTFEIECCSGGSSCESGTFSILNEVLRSIVVKMKGCRVEAAVMILLVLLLESGFFWKCIKIYVKSDLKVNQIQNEFMTSSFLPKCQPKITEVSA